MTSEEKIDYCLGCVLLLNEYEGEFLNSVKALVKERFQLTPKQKSVLDKLYDKLR